MLGRVGRFIRSNTVGLVALFAAFVALAGGAGALPGVGTVDSGDIRDGAVKAVDIRGGAVGPTDLAPSVRPRWARVQGVNGALVRHRGATESVKIGDGEYNVTFASPITNCGWTATLNGFNVGGLHPDGELSVQPGGSRVLHVQYFNSDGIETFIPDGITSTSGFTVAVHC